MLHWRVILLACLAILLLVAGLTILILPDSYEGPAFYHFDEQHSIRALDFLGAILLALGCAIAWGAGGLWQRKMYAS